jgi:hypothetical protein
LTLPLGAIFTISFFSVRFKPYIIAGMWWVHINSETK